MQKITGRPFGKGDSLLADGKAAANGEGGQGQQTPVAQAPVASPGNNGTVDTSPIRAEKGDGHIDNTSATGEGQSTSGDDTGSGQHHPPKDPPDDDTNPNPAPPPGPLWFRVEGGERGEKQNYTLERIDVAEDGSIKTIRNKKTSISFSAVHPDHAEYFMNKRGPHSRIVVFEVDSEFHEKIMDSMVKQSGNKGKSVQ